MLFIYGGFILLSGFLKSIGASHETNFSIGDTRLTIHNPTNWPFIILFNFLGGFCLIYFALKTRGYNKYIITDIEMLDEQKTVHNTSLLSGLTIFTGFWSVLVGLWMLFRGISLLSVFENNVLDNIILIILVLMYYIPFGLVPLISVFNNLSTHNDIKKRNETLAFHARKQKKST